MPQGRLGMLETKGDDDGMATSLTKAMPASMASMLSLTKVMLIPKSDGDPDVFGERVVLTKVVSIPKSMTIPASMVSGSVPDQGDVDPKSMAIWSASMAIGLGRR
ncbi:unnamed protein product [Urochloa humidicola]